MSILAALVAAAPAWGNEPTPDPYSYAMARGCKFVHPSGDSYRATTRLLKHERPVGPDTKHRVHKWAVCVATRRKAHAVHEHVRTLWRWRRNNVCLPTHGNAALGRCMARRDYGWVGAQFGCLDALWGGRESGWSTSAHNSSSGAHGIPQALPGWKMGPGWESDPVVQIRWGLGYIAGRYGTPCGALSHSSSTGWY